MDTSDNSDLGGDQFTNCKFISFFCRLGFSWSFPPGWRQWDSLLFSLESVFQDYLIQYDRCCNFWMTGAGTFIAEFESPNLDTSISSTLESRVFAFCNCVSHCFSRDKSSTSDRAVESNQHTFEQFSAQILSMTLASNSGQEQWMSCLLKILFYYLLSWAFVMILFECL